MKNVLILDDEAGLTQIVESVLTMSGYKVTKFNSPVEALKIVDSAQFDIMIVDLLMPEMTGIEFLKEATEKQKIKPHYVVLTGKLLSEEERRTIFELGGSIMGKPFKPRELLDTISNLFG